MAIAHATNISPTVSRPNSTSDIPLDFARILPAMCIASM